MRRTPLLPMKLAVVPLLVLMAFGSAEQAQDTALVWIAKQQAVSLPAHALETLTVFQELQAAWIAEGPLDRLADLQARGLAFEVLDAAPAGKEYFLASTSGAAPHAFLAGVVHARVIDERTSLVWTESGDARELLPSGVAIKRLSPLPALRVTLERLPSGPLARRRAAALAPVQAAPAIAEMVAQVSKGRLIDQIKALQAFQTRYASTAKCELAGASLYDSLRALGLATEYDPFRFAAAQHPTSNIVATLPGRTTPRKVVIVGAHYDSYSTAASTSAPGADDNASGTAAVMEMARVLSGYSFDFTIRLIAFSAEEWGLYGSRHYAQAARLAGEQIVGVVNLDMIGYADGLPEDLDVIVNRPSEWLGDAFLASSDRYAPMPLVKVVNASFTYSDHSPFWDQGYAALCGIEDAVVHNPYYHKPTDVFETLDMDFAVASTRAALALVAALAQPYDSPEPPASVSVAAYVNRSLFFTSKAARIAWTPSRSQVSGYNVYRAETRHGAYRRINSAPVTSAAFTDRFLNLDATYYYVITSVDAGGKESNYSEEVSDANDAVKIQ